MTWSCGKRASERTASSSIPANDKTVEAPTEGPIVFFIPIHCTCLQLIIVFAMVIVSNDFSQHVNNTQIY